MSNPNSDIYCCNIKPNANTKLTGIDISVNIIGNHLSSMSYDDVKEFNMENGILMNYLPVNLHEVLKNLEVITIIGVHLKGIFKNNLIHFYNLRRLDLRNNELTSLESDLFIGNPKLTGLYLEDNQFQRDSFDVRFLEYASNLREYKIFNNILIKNDTITEKNCEQFIQNVIGHSSPTCPSCNAANSSCNSNVTIVYQSTEGQTTPKR